MRTAPVRVVLVSLLLVPMLAAADQRAVRLARNPIITPETSPTIGANINGPSLIRVPDWAPRPLGRYYLYFAHHIGSHIRMAYADQVQGPWTVYEPGVLRLADVPTCHDHIASPDVHVDAAAKTIRMYFHCPSGTGTAIEQQSTFAATSGDGLHFTTQPQSLGPAYFRVFAWRGEFYAVVRSGLVLKSRDGISPFEAGPTLIPEDKGRTLRHAALDRRGDTLDVYYSRIGDAPERILVSHVRLGPDWRAWRASAPEVVLEPERDWEGGMLPLEVSKVDEAPGRVRQLRDPGIFNEGGRTYLLYSVAGESGLGIAELKSAEAR